MNSVNLLELFLGFFCASMALTILRSASPRNNAS